MIFWLSLRRLAYITFVFARHALAHALGALVRRWPRLARRLRAGGLSGPERLRAALEEVGGTFIKFGQMLALQPDILSLRYCDALFNLLDRVTPFRFEEVERIFAEELGATPLALFDDIDTRPIATASIGQVHVARLGGRKLAVKVQRPNVETDFAGDIRLMAAAIRLIKRFRLRPLYWLLEPLGEFLAWTHEELDYRCEARYMERLRRNARGNPRERVPEVSAQFTTRRTLVTEFLEGETLLAYLRDKEGGDGRVAERLRAAGFEPDRAARNIIDNFLGDVFRHGMFHADLHPANLMILPGDAVGYVDFGITGAVSRYSRQNLVAMTLAYTRGDLDSMCDSFFKVSVTDSESSEERFREGVRRLADDWYAREGRGRRLRKSFTMVMLDMLRLSRATGVWPERDVIKYIRSAIALDGLITRFAPGFDLGRHLQEVCDGYLKLDVWRALMTYDTVLGWTISGGRVAEDGVLRGASFLRRFASGEVRASAEVNESRGARDGALRRRSLQLASAVLAVSLLVVSTGGGSGLGVNLFTAEAAFVAAAALMLLQTVRRLA